MFPTYLSISIVVVVLVGEEVRILLEEEHQLIKGVLPLLPHGLFPEVDWKIALNIIVTTFRQGTLYTLPSP